jgi:mannose-1-phosphate guanylyltransferase/mannose-6-phosphate isomerase
VTARFVLILAGGRGERFWPWSRPERPKQLLPLARGGRTLLAATIERALLLVPPERILVLTARDLVPAVRRECPPGVAVIGEPVARNTAAAIAAAAHWFARDGADASLAVMPADHAIDDHAAFRGDVERAFALAEREAVLLTFGIRPTHPEVNFGYIRRGEPLGERLYRVAQFAEKPDRARAEAWVSGGGHLWNSGIFVWRAGTFLRALEAARPALATTLAALGSVRDLAFFERALESAFPGAESISVDHAVLEHAPNVLALEAAFDWDDLGSWGAWARRQPQDARGNVLFGDALAIDCDDCVVVGDGGTAAAMGLRGMVVVHAQGATLSCRLEDSDRVRRVGEALRARGGA